MIAVNANKTGLLFGVLIGSWHLLWSILVALGWAQAVVDFIFWLHFIKPIYVIEPFAIARALLLIAVTGMIAYIMGLCGALLWNWMHRRAVG